MLDISGSSFFDYLYKISGFLALIYFSFFSFAFFSSSSLFLSTYLSSKNSIGSVLSPYLKGFSLMTIEYFSML